MTKKTRLIILLGCVTIFLIITPILVFYSMGYRFDFETMAVKATGGIYVRTFPAAEQVIIDGKNSFKPGLFSNNVFIQSLLPKSHTVFIEKTGYYNYSKTLIVKENQVAKLENVILFKDNIGFQEVIDQTTSPFINSDKFVVKSNNLYYSNILENSTLTATQKTTSIISKLITFLPQGNTIIWLGTDGLLYKTDLSNLKADPIKVILTPIKIVKSGVYKIISDGKNLLLNSNGDLLILNTKTNELDLFASSVKNARISPDDKYVIYYTGKDLYISLLTIDSSLPIEKILLYTSSEAITDCLWLNKDYVIISTASKIIISEIDNRGNTNTITLPQTAIVGIETPEKIGIKNPQIFFNGSEGKLYVLTGKILLATEKITP